MKTIFGILFSLLSLSVHAAPVSVSAPQWWSDNGASSVSFQLSKPARYTLFTLSNPDRLVVDFRNARYTGKSAQRISGHPLIRKIRSGARKGGDYRVVFDLKQGVVPHSFLAANGSRLVIELAPRNRQAIRTPAAATPVATAPAPRVVKKRQQAESRDREEQGLFDRLFSTLSSDRQAERTIADPRSGRDVVVVIDAGHGGHDVGARGRYGTQEKDVALGIARRLAALVEREPGMRAVLTRSGDYFIKLRERMKIARDANADLFISVHANGYKNAQAKGASVYILSPKGASSEAAKLLAEKENSAESIGTIDLVDKDDNLKAVLIDLSQSATIAESHDVAGRVLKEMGGNGRIHLRKVQKAGFAVLKSPDVPSILVETAFITNPEEERKLSNAGHQLTLARSILTGARNYFYANPPPGSIIAARVDQMRTVADVRQVGRTIPES